MATIENQSLYLLGISLVIGLLIGIERGWHARAAKEGTRIAGLRTFTLMGILGGIAGIITTRLGVLAFAFIFFGFSILVILSYTANVKTREDVSITSLVAALITFLLGTLATLGYVAISLSTAIVVALLLRLKPLLHSWLKRIKREELLAALELLLISVVFLNIFPNEGLGPWKSFNPFQIWLMVVLVATISFIGYFSMKLAGPKKGVLLIALFSGFVSSTALTLHFSKLAKEKKEMVNLFSVGILLASAVLYLRTLLLILILNASIIAPLIGAFSAMSSILLAASYFIWRKVEKIEFFSHHPIKNPLDLKTALIFGAFLSIITVLIHGVQQMLGETGLYVLSSLSGFVDVDAIVIALTRMSIQETWSKVIVNAIIFAICANTLFKALLAYFVGGSRMLFQVCLPLVMSIGIGLIFVGIFI